ncbi:TIGR02186 family protein [Novispirillum sp. DQ9]|uniref:TIGR02186 family protein n=1 Tax=Novispirillum sp. DQ9 TaxID=3398612 RepID=UPI003C7DDE7A
MRTVFLSRLAALAIACLALLPAVSASVPAHAQAQEHQRQPLVADLSRHLVAITTGFAGTDVLLFGATDEPGDVVLVVRGPNRDEIVRRKERLGGMIWANGAAVTLHDVPAFYRVAANRPLEDILARPARERHQIGADVLNLRMSGSVAPEDRGEFREALVRLKGDRDLYSYGEGAVNMLANRLFRTELHFPANVPTGTYMVEVYLVRDGEVISAEITPLIISKVGIGADIFQFAHQQSALYGIAAIIIAVFAGWLAGVAFRKK